MHSDRHCRARAVCQPVPRSEEAARVPKPTCSSAQAPDLPQAGVATATPRAGSQTVVASLSKHTQNGRF
eukprot:4192185-Prymnesium_polylepis.1